MVMDIKILFIKILTSEWLSIIANICSIVALPIAIWQIIKIKSRVKSTEKGIMKILNINKHANFSSLLSELKKQHISITELTTQKDKRGTSSSSYTEKINNMIIELTRISSDIPIEHEDIAKELRKAIEYLKDFSTTDNLNQAEAILYSSIRSLQKIIDEYSKQEILNTIK